MKNIIIMILLLSAMVFSQNADIDLLRKINVDRNQRLDNFFLLTTNSTSFISIGVPLALLGTGLLTKDSLMSRDALFTGASLVTAGLLSTCLKYGVDRTRPFVTYPDIQKCTDGGSPSFPSGHTSEAFAFATSMSIAYPKWYIIGPTFLWATAVGYSRMDLGVHYPSDVLAGALVGAGSAWLCYEINKRLLSKHNRK